MFVQSGCLVDRVEGFWGLRSGFESPSGYYACVCVGGGGPVIATAIPCFRACFRVQRVFLGS